MFEIVSTTLGRLARRRRELLTAAAASAAATLMCPPVEDAARCSLVGFPIHPCGEGGIENKRRPFLAEGGSPSTSATPWSPSPPLPPLLAALKTER